MSICGRLPFRHQVDPKGQFADLEAEARPRIDRHAPDWSDHSDSDPGITILELSIFLLVSLVYFVGVFRLLRAVGMIDRVRWAVSVEEGWTRVDDLAESGPEDRHYVIDPKTGEVRFGDGVQGAPRPSGSAYMKSRYGVGGGAARAVGASVTVWAGLLAFSCRLRGRRAS